MEKFLQYYHLILLIFRHIANTGGLRSFIQKLFSFIGHGNSQRIVQKWHKLRYQSRRPIDLNDYDFWVQQGMLAIDQQQSEILSEIEQFKQQPLISVIMPVYNPPINFLKEAIESVQNQLYNNWELCIADDASSDPQVQQCLQSYSQTDSRIKVTYRKSNGHIAKASNSALKLASGEFLALLDQDDLLSKDALYWVVKDINARPELKLIYSDEDKVDTKGHRSNAYFKSDWNLDLFFAQNLFSHLGVYDTALVRQVGGFRHEYIGSQDYDLVLRCIELIEPRQISHIPRVLYHWRMIPGSTAISCDEKPYAIKAGVRAVNDYFTRQKISAKAELGKYGHKVSFQLPKHLPLVSIIIPTHNGNKYLQQCIESLTQKTTYPNYEIIIIDNASDDLNTLDYLAEIQQQENIRLIVDNRAFNYSALNNQAVRQAKGDIIALVNDDIEVITENWLSEMVSHVLRPNIGAVGAKLLYKNNSIQHAGIILGLGGVAGHVHQGLYGDSSGYYGRAALTQSFSAVTAACLVVKKSVFEQVGGFDEIDLAIAFNDVDFCLKLLQAGYTNILAAEACLIHHESISRGKDSSIKQQQRFDHEVDVMKQRWADLLSHDPAYNPNLSLVYKDMSLAMLP